MKIESDRCLEVLKAGGIFLYPTDTVWGIGCDAANSAAVKKVFALKNRSESKSLIILVADTAMLPEYFRIVSEEAVNMMNESEIPLTVIFPDAKNLAAEVIAEDGSVAVRLVITGFAGQLLRAFGKPVVSTSANIAGEPTPGNFNEISKEIVDGVDYIVDSGIENRETGRPSRIIKFTPEGDIQIIRS